MSVKKRKVTDSEFSHFAGIYGFVDKLEERLPSGLATPPGIARVDNVHYVTDGEDDLWRICEEHIDDTKE